MAEGGIDNFALAKRKAARSLGAPATEALPGNDEIEAELREVALDAMRTFERFHPYLTGPVLKGTAGPYAEIELQLFPESSKEVELHLLERDINFETQEARRYSGDRVHAVSIFTLLWQDTPLKLSVFDPRDERVALKTSQAGRVMQRAGIAELAALLRDEAA
ncbi:MAG: hypothetical protein QOD26_150 [Betaproteobacteria bacterium]|nr:hypothetical protein [Betaproteobacteria bacterium]